MWGVSGVRATFGAGSGKTGEASGAVAGAGGEAASEDAPARDPEVVMSGLPELQRTTRIRTGMGVDVLVHRLPHVPGALVLDFLSHQERPEVLVPVTGGPSIEDPRVARPGRITGEQFAILLAEAVAHKPYHCHARDAKRGPRLGGYKKGKTKKRRGRRHAQTDDWLD